MSRPKRSSAFVGLVAVVVLAIVAFLGFTKDIPFTHGYTLKAQFESANSIRPNSPVRIAGVEVGKVKSVEALQGTNAAVLTMELKKSALPIHEDATAKIRPRIFLEGNFFVDLKPGTPQSPTLHSGDTLKISQTATPVQLDQVLTSLQSDSREDLKQVLDGFSTALNDTRDGKSGAQSLNDAYDDIPSAESSSAQVLQALLGTEPGRDVARLIRGTANTADALDRNESQLQGLITNLNTTMAAFAGESENLQASIRELPPTLRNADSALASLNAAFPSTRAFAREILPGVRETPATIDAAFPWIAQTRALVGKSELGGLAQELSPATADLTRLIDRAEELLPQTDLASKCVRDIVLPAGDVVIKDEFTTGVENYKEFFYALVGLAGEGQNTDGNGMYVRFQTGGGSQTVSLGSKSANTGELFGNNVQVPLGNRPAYPGKRPPYKPDVPCYTNKLPDLNGPAAAKTAPTGTTASTAQATSVSDRLKRQADLEAVRAKLHPFDSKRSR
ncbi:MlaD family protein [Candidatus Solirubrobacter pratensis]|uniref:MlaD family protein n=1 Tax=Candidatus Solirubrobacter pratensis TaxID=1298857 RepID=UPI000422462C|nr:MlaD family protein [Candidatus Solirubrobacter pratensis]